MNNEKILNNLAILKDKYGDISISELIKKINEDSNNTQIKDIKISYIKHYGQGCNELAGEYYDCSANSLIELLQDITNYKTTILNSSKYKEYKNKEDYYKLEDEELINELAQAIHNGYIGNSYDESYQLTFMERIPSIEEIVKYLKNVRLDENGLSKLISIV